MCGAEPCESSGASGGTADSREETGYKRADANDGVWEHEDGEPGTERVVFCVFTGMTWGGGAIYEADVKLNVSNVKHLPAEVGSNGNFSGICTLLEYLLFW